MTANWYHSQSVVIIAMRRDHCHQSLAKSTLASLIVQMLCYVEYFPHVLLNVGHIGLSPTDACQL